MITAHNAVTNRPVQITVESRNGAILITYQHDDTSPGGAIRLDRSAALGMAAKLLALITNTNDARQDH